MAQVLHTTSQSASYEAAGSLYRDISPILTNIDPDNTPLLSSIPDGEEAHEMQFEWQLDSLRPPKVNQRPEFDTYTYDKVEGVGRMNNYCQIFRVDGKVSDVMQKAWKTYNPKTNELARIIEKRTKELARDIEFAIMANATANAETAGGTLAMTGGIPYFLKEETMAVTVDGTTNNDFATSTAHNLETGKWVYIKAATMPTAKIGNASTGASFTLAPNIPYYIRRVPITNGFSTTEFELFTTMEAAVKNDTTKRIYPTSAGTTVAIILNNVVDAGGNAFTLTNINDAVQMSKMRGGTASEMWMSYGNKRRFSQLANSVHTTQKSQTDHRLDEVVTTYETDFGVIKAQVHGDLPDDEIYILDPSYWRLRWFDRAHITPDSQLAKDGSYQKFVATAIMGLEATQPLASTAITNIG